MGRDTNHTQKTQVCALGVDNIPLTNETSILMGDANGPVDEPQDGGNVVGDEAEDCFVKDPYNPKYFSVLKTEEEDNTGF